MAVHCCTACLCNQKPSASVFSCVWVSAAESLSGFQSLENVTFFFFLTAVEAQLLDLAQASGHDTWIYRSTGNDVLLYAFHFVLN